MIYEFFTINLPRFIENLRLELVYAGILSPRIISLRDMYHIINITLIVVLIFVVILLNIIYQDGALVFILELILD